MLAIKQKSSLSGKTLIMAATAFTLFAGGLYMLSLVAAPTIAPYISLKQIDASALEQPKPSEDRVVIPKIGVDIAYGTDGEAALDRGAWWRYPDRGNPQKGGNFIIAAHRFSLAPTPQQTVVKSPFYHIDKLALDDEIIIDYNGTRYGYTIDNITDVKPTQTEIEAPSETAKLTLYSCSLGGENADRVVITASPLGEVTLGNGDSNSGGA